MQFPSLFSFCPHCAEKLRAFDRDGISRHRCPACGWIQYRNPTVGVAAVLVEESRLLIGRRRSDGWCIPCGHVEYDESVEQAVVREMAEETGLDVSLQGIVAVKSNFHDPRHQTVGIWFLGQRRGGALRPGGDLAEAAFVDFASLPPLQFPSDREVVELVRATQKTQN